MEWKRILLLFSIILIIATFYRTILNNWEPLFREGLATTSASSSANKDNNKSKLETNQSILDCCNNYLNDQTLPLREYFVMSSFNSGYNGSDVSMNTLKQRIFEGYRFLDLNVFYSNDKLYVGFSQDNNPSVVSTSLPFETALSGIQQWGFQMPPSSYTSTLSSTSATGGGGDGPSLLNNYYNYPLFIHIRVYRPPNSQNDIVSKIAEVINKLGYSQFHRNKDNKPVQINGCTHLNQLMGKIIFTMDIENILQIYTPTNTPNAEYVPAETIKSIQSFANMLTGGNTCLAFYDYEDAQLKEKTTKLRINDQLNNQYKTNIQYMFIAYPNPANEKNPDTYKLALNNSIQFIPLRVYLSDYENEYLKKYKRIFNDLKRPFVPMSSVYTTVNRIQSESPSRSKI